MPKTFSRAAPGGCRCACTQAHKQRNARGFTKRQLLQLQLFMPCTALVSRDAQAAQMDKNFTSQTAGFAFDYPSRWAIAFDRSGQQVPGTLIVVGDFNSNYTLSVARSKLSDYGVPDLKPEDLKDPQQQQKLLDGVRGQVGSQRGIFDFEVVSSGFPDGPDGTKFFDMEFTIGLCRGEIIEMSGGRKRCVNPDDSDIPTNDKHIYQRAFVTNNGELIAAASGTLLSKWDSASDELTSAVKTFRPVTKDASPDA